MHSVLVRAIHEIEMSGVETQILQHYSGTVDHLLRLVPHVTCTWKDPHFHILQVEVAGDDQALGRVYATLNALFLEHVPANGKPARTPL